MNGGINFNFGPVTPGGNQVPFNRAIDPAAMGMFISLEQRDMERLKRYQEHWAFYLGKHWAFTREDSEPLVTLNLVKVLVDKGVTWLVGNGFKFDTPQALHKAIVPHLEETWDDHNDRQALLVDIATMAGVTGDCWVLITPIEPTETMRRTFPHVNTFIKIHPLGSEGVFPYWDRVDTERMHAVKIVTVLPLQNAPGETGGMHPGPLRAKRFIQTIYPDKIIEYMEGEEPKVKPNALGEIPVAHFRNIKVPKEYYGLSDLDTGVVDLQRELNEKATDMSDIINYQAQPVTVVIGAKVKNLERGAKKIWSGLPQGATVSNLELMGDLGAHMRYIEFIRKTLMEVAEFPEDAFGAAQGVSNTSGVALRLRMQPIMERIARKRPGFEAGLAQVNYFILRWKQVMDGLQLPYGFCKNCGGRVVEVQVTRPDGKPRLDRFGRPLMKRKCYHADPFTGDFIEPDEMRLKFVRQFSFGSEMQEAERWRIAAMMLNARASFWDPFAGLQAGGDGEEGKLVTQEDAAKQYEEDRKVLSPKKRTPEEMFALTYKPIHLPQGAIDVPAEPENVTMRVERFDERTGRKLMQVRDGIAVPYFEEETRFIIPTTCEDPSYYNPMSTKAKLEDALPHDEHLDAQLATQLVTAGLWSRRRGMKYVGVENVEKEMKDVQADNWTTTDQTKAGGVTGEDIPSTSVQGTEATRAAMSGGDPNQPAPDGAPMMGKNQGEE